MPVLPADQPILLEVPDSLEGSLDRRVGQHPADVGMEETFGDVVRIIVVVHKLVVLAMVGSPAQDGIFKRGAAEDQREQPHRPAGLKGEMGEQPMVAQCNTQARGDKENEEQNNLEPIQALPQPRWPRGQMC